MAVLAENEEEESESTDDPKGEDVSSQALRDTSASKRSKDLFKVYVAGLPFNCDKTAVRKHFSSCGEIDWLHMPRDSKERFRGIAFISFWAQESVDAALRLNGTYYGDYLLKVNMAGDKPNKCSQQADSHKSDAKAAAAPKQLAEETHSKRHKDGVSKGEQSKDRKVFIGNIPFACTAETLRKDFAECGSIQQLAMPSSNGKSRGIAFVTFNTKEGVAKALKYHGADYGGSKLTVRLACEKVEKGKLKGIPRVNESSKVEEETGEPNPLQVIVKGLAFGTKEAALREELALCGAIESVRVPLNRKGKSVGFAFVVFQDAKAVKKAIKLSGSLLAGRTCQIERIGDRPCKHMDEGKTRKAVTEQSGDVEEIPNTKAKRKKIECEVEEEDETLKVKPKKRKVDDDDDEEIPKIKAKKKKVELQVEEEHEPRKVKAKNRKVDYEDDEETPKIKTKKKKVELDLQEEYEPVKAKAKQRKTHFEEYVEEDEAPKVKANKKNTKDEQGEEDEEVPTTKCKTKKGKKE